MATLTDLRELTNDNCLDGKLDMKISCPTTPLQAEVQADMPPPMTLTATEKQPDSSVLHVLVVEDDEFHSTVMQMLLDDIANPSKAGDHDSPSPLPMDVKIVASAEEAAGVLSTNRVDIAIVDFVLPGANGGELAKACTEQFAESGTVFIACSADHELMESSRIQTYGMCDVLKKPVSTAALRATLNKWMPRELDVDITVLRTPTGKLLRALYVEDCRIQAMAGSHLLQQLGIHVDIAETGTEALNLLRSSRRYYIVVIDLTLPDMSGYAVCSAYRQHCAEAGLPSGLKLALTAGDAEPGWEDFGFARCLTKPLSSATVLDLLRAWLASPGARALDEATSSLDSA